MPDKSLAKVKQVLWVILFANIAVAAVKIVAGYFIQSASLVADGFHSLTDGVSNIVGLIGIWFAAQPIDEKHPYGHRKYEFITGLFIGFMLLIIALLVVYEAVSKFAVPVVPNVTDASLVALVVTLAINIFVCTYEYRQGVKLGSPILISDSQHTRSDVYVSISVLGTLIGIKLGLPPIIDPIASLLVAAFIIRAAVEIIKSTSEVLVDKAVADIAAIEEIVLSFSQVRGVHDIRSRGSVQQLFIDMHILVDTDMAVVSAHQLSHDIEQRIQQQLQHQTRVMIHTEPFRM